MDLPLGAMGDLGRQNFRQMQVQAWPESLALLIRERRITALATIYYLSSHRHQSNDYL